MSVTAPEFLNPKDVLGDYCQQIVGPEARKAGGLLTRRVTTRSEALRSDNDRHGVDSVTGMRGICRRSQKGP